MSSHLHSPSTPAGPVLSPRERRVVIALATAAIPPGFGLTGGGAPTAERLEPFLRSLPPGARRAYRAGLWVLETASLARTGRCFSSLDEEARQRALERWVDSSSRIWRDTIRGLLTPLKLHHFDVAEMFEAAGCTYRWPPVRDDEPRWLAQIHDGARGSEDLELACEVVVVGTGAGGAAVAYELAAQGRAVLLVEEGDYHRRASFTGRPARAYRTLYRDQALTLSLGNVTIPIWAGRAVGGTTVINSGTCYRAPDHTLTRWRDRYGLPADFSTRGLAPYYRRVEDLLDVAPADPQRVGMVGELVARGARRLGWSHGVVRRNAPDCDGQGVCCYGCPTGAKRSTDVSYIPAALNKGAQLVTGARVTRVQIHRGRACGVEAELRSGRRLRVAAEVVVVAGGTIMSPLLLERSGACGSSDQLGRNLSLHPATGIIGEFAERVDMSSAIPQGCAIDHFQSQGLMMEGGSVPLDVAAIAVRWTGPRFSELLARYPHLAMFGVMVQDHSRGRVRAGRHGRPLVTYVSSRRDARQLQHGLALLCQAFLAAGARRVLPMAAGQDEIRSPAGIQRLRHARLRPSDLEITAFHALGTCRMGSDPGRSCIGPDHEAHDVAGLYVCDGSALPSSLGVNPQLTIMATAVRAADIIHSRLG